jgi:hypothetical protein
LPESFELLAESLPESPPESFDDGAPPSEDDADDEPLADFVDDRESVMYQPLPLKTMPTG